jgi:hypothetical protein
MWFLAYWIYFSKFFSCPCPFLLLSFVYIWDMAWFFSLKKLPCHSQLDLYSILLQTVYKSSINSINISAQNSTIHYIHRKKKQYKLQFVTVQIFNLPRSLYCANHSLGPYSLFFGTAQDSVPGSDTFLTVQQCGQKLQLDLSPTIFSNK